MKHDKISLLFLEGRSDPAKKGQGERSIKYKCSEHTGTFLSLKYKEINRVSFNLITQTCFWLQTVQFDIQKNKDIKSAKKNTNLKKPYKKYEIYYSRLLAVAAWHALTKQPSAVYMWKYNYTIYIHPYIRNNQGTQIVEVAAFFSAICSQCKEVKEPCILCQTLLFAHYWPIGCS